VANSLFVRKFIKENIANSSLFPKNYLYFPSYMYFGNKTTFCLGLALILFLSCADNSDVEFPSKDEVRQRYSSSSAEVAGSSSSGQSSSSALNKCNDGTTYNPADGFCYGDDYYDKCNGQEYDPASQICDDKKAVPAKCNNVPYNPLTQGCCANSEIFPISTQFCQSGTNVVKDFCGTKTYTATQFCYNSSKVADFCGNRTQTYDPNLYECKSINPNGIYLKQKPKDSDNNSYEAVLIGTQTWMAQNLKKSKYNSYCPIDSDTDCISMKLVDEVDDNDICSNYVAWHGGGYSDDNLNNCAKYGRLYKWDTVINDSDPICPQGWHIPSAEDWNILLKFVEPECDLSGLVGICDSAGTQLKAASTWSDYYNNNSYVTNGTDDYGFAALPSSYGEYHNWGPDVFILNRGLSVWWSSSIYDDDGIAYFMAMVIGVSSEAFTLWIDDNHGLYSVRCLKNQDE